ncbi:MAG: hypothetical protein HYY30_06940 [Chloroflexi bacterium]|nr:hypothetical protein [Chloroflexota bacterium]
MAANGSVNNVLFVDLTSGSTRREQLGPEVVRKYIGGFGVAARLAYDLIGPDVEPLSAENTIIISAGALVGTAIPGASKITGVTRYPMTGAIAPASAGGSFGFAMKMAGYDHIVITGKAPAPSYLKIDDRVQVCSGDGLWGKDIFATTDALYDKYPSGSVIAIGVPGERQAKISFAMVDKVAHFGRGGLAAVLGAKNLKAIVAEPADGQAVGVADQERLMKVVDRVFQRILTNPLRPGWLKDGVRIGWPSWSKGEFSYANFRKYYTREDAAKLYEPERWHERIGKQIIACPSCPIADKGMFCVKCGEFEGLTTYASELLQSLIGFGVQCNVGADYNKLLKLHDTATRYGLDLFTTAYMFNWIVELHERGIISDDELHGLDPKIGFDTTMELMRQIAEREGLGAILADGWKDAIARIGRGSERYAVHIKGMEPSYMDARFNFGTEIIGEVVNPRGAVAIASESTTIIPARTSDKMWRHCEKIHMPEDARDRAFLTKRIFNVGIINRYNEDWYYVADGLGVCMRQQIMEQYSFGRMTDAYAAVTGFDVTQDELIQGGERIFNLLKAANVRLGFERKDDKFPERWFEPARTEDGTKEMPLMDYYETAPYTREEVVELFDDYYRERGWDVERGIPTGAKLEELDLGDVAADLTSRGIL